MRARVLRIAAIVTFGVLCVVGIFLLVRGGIGFQYSEASSIGEGVASFDELADRFETLAQMKGGEYAYVVLRMATLPQNTDLHLLGHVVGDVLYTQQNIAGIEVCTPEFRNACSHTIVTGALQEFGTGAETRALIDDACKRAPGGMGAYTMCYHGLGHGVFAFFGYDLKETVAFCKNFGTEEYAHEQFTQCVGGAIMELFSGGGHDRDAWLAARERYLPPDEPLAPCNNALIPESTKGHCYLYLTPRLFEFAGADIGNPNPATFPRAFSYCDTLPRSAQKSREACFGGFGKEFVPLAAARDIRAIDALDDAAYARAAGWCELAASDEGKDFCIRQALESVFWGGENDTSASFRFCATTPQTLTDGCFRYLARIIGHYLRGESRALWCARLPESYRVACGNKI